MEQRNGCKFTVYYYYYRQFFKQFPVPTRWFDSAFYDV